MTLGKLAKINTTFTTTAGKTMSHLQKLFAFAIVALLSLSALPAQAKTKDKTKVTATWVAPQGGSTFTAPATIVLSANAESKQASKPIVAVEFFNGASLIGSQTTAVSGINYQLTWPNLTPGTYSLSAVATNDKGDYDDTVPVTITVVKANQTISGFSPATPITYSSNASFMLSASGGASGNPVTFGSSTPGVCTVSGNIATVLGAGTCTLTADQAGGVNYNTATQAIANIAINKANQVIAGFNPATPVTYAPNLIFTLSAIGGASGNPVTFATTAPSICTVANNVVNVLKAGTCTISADQAMDGNYNAAGTVTASVVIDKIAQTIVFAPLPDKTLGDAAFAVTATASSGLAISFASATVSICTVANSQITLVATGTCTITANQAGDANTVAAPAVIQSFAVKPAAPAEAQMYFIHADHLGTPRAITRPVDNQVVWKWDNSDPFGANLPNENPSGLGIFKNNNRFPGQYYDEETGTNYNYFRDYDPSTGRYVQSDPIGLKGGINTYAYVSNDPLRFSDPRGLVKWSGEVYGGGGMAGVGGMLYWFDLKSECVNDQYAFIRVFGSAFMFGFGIRGAPSLGGSASAVDFEDGLSTLDPYGFQGDFKVSQAGIGAILTGGYNIYKVGRNTSSLNLLDPSKKGLSRIEPQPGIGIDASIGSGIGRAMVTSVEYKDCKCKEPR